MRVSHKMVWAQFWSAHQRFFKYLCIGAKVRMRAVLGLLSGCIDILGYR